MPYFTNGLFATLSISVADPDPNMFLGLLDPEPDPLVRGMDPDPSITKRKYSKKNLDSYTALRLLFDFLSLKKLCKCTFQN
jgi:hypothetical protein